MPALLYPLDDLLTTDAREPESIEDALRSAMAFAWHTPNVPPVRCMSEREFWEGVSLGLIKPSPWVEVVTIPSRPEALRARESLARRLLPMLLLKHWLDKDAEHFRELAATSR